MWRVGVRLQGSRTQGLHWAGIVVGPDLNLQLWHLRVCVDGFCSLHFSWSLCDVPGTHAGHRGLGHESGMWSLVGVDGSGEYMRLARPSSPSFTLENLVEDIPGSRPHPSPVWRTSRLPEMNPVPYRPKARGWNTLQSRCSRPHKAS